jgi:Pyridoxal-phosphate dependent enzyme
LQILGHSSSIIQLSIVFLTKNQKMMLARNFLQKGRCALPSIGKQTLSPQSHRFFSTDKTAGKTLTKEEEKASKPDGKNDNGFARRRDDLQKTRDELPVTFADISRAHVAIRDGVVRTRCEQSYFLSELVGANIFIKPEFRQFTGSFKERGARNAILTLKRDMGGELKGVIAASAGNHALALAYHGKQLGVPVTVVMPTVAPLAKVDKCRVRVIFGACHQLKALWKTSHTFSSTIYFSFLEIRGSRHHRGGSYWRVQNLRGSSGGKRGGTVAIYQWL